MMKTTKISISATPGSRTVLQTKNCSEKFVQHFSHAWHVGNESPNSGPLSGQEISRLAMRERKVMRKRARRLYKMALASHILQICGRGFR